MTEQRDPIVHFGITDELPPDHPWAFESLDCIRCGQMVHAFNNETMTWWVETGKGPVCFDCFLLVLGEDDLEDEGWGLTGPVAAFPDRLSEVEALNARLRGALEEAIGLLKIWDQQTVERGGTPLSSDIWPRLTIGLRGGQ